MKIGAGVGACFVLTLDRFQRGSAKKNDMVCSRGTILIQNLFIAVKMIIVEHKIK